MSTNNKTRSVPSHRPSKPFIVVILIIVALGLGLYLAKGWIAQTYYSYEARSSFTSEFKKLEAPLEALGLKKDSNELSKCNYQEIYGSTESQLQCISRVNTYVVIGDDTQSKALFNTKAQELALLLQNDGWNTFSNSAPTLSEWFQGITSGKDYSTDIISSKNSGDSRCSLAFNVAYSNPKPPAFVVQMSCSSPALGGAY